MSVAVCNVFQEMMEVVVSHSLGLSACRQLNFKLLCSSTFVPGFYYRLQ